MALRKSEQRSCHPRAWRTALPGTLSVGETEQIYLLQKIQFLPSVCPPKTRVLLQEPVRHRRCRHIPQGGGGGSPMGSAPARCPPKRRPQSVAISRQCHLPGTAAGTLCQELQRLKSSRRVPVGPGAPGCSRSLHKHQQPSQGTRMLGVMGDDKGQRHQETHVKTAPNKRPSPRSPSTPSSEESVCRGTAVPGDAATFPAWPCPKGDRLPRAGGRDGAHGPEHGPAEPKQPQSIW